MSLDLDQIEEAYERDDLHIVNILLIQAYLAGRKE